MVSPAAHRVAIIGAGISGASAAAQLRARMGSRLGRVDVFERASQPGGRAMARTVAGAHVELGASVLYSGNAHVMGAAARHGLTLERPFRVDRELSAGMWRDGCEVFRVGGDGVWTRALDVVRMAARYGPLSLVRTQRLVGDMLKRFLHVYDEDAQRLAFVTPTALLEWLGLSDLARERSDAWLRAHGVSACMVDEFVDGIARSNYAQPASGLNAFVNSVSLVGGGFGGDGHLVAVRGGNARVVTALLDEARTALHTRTPIGHVHAPPRGSGGMFALFTECGEPAGEFDGVVLATPVETAGRLRLHGAAMPPRRPMQRLCVTVLRGERVHGAPDVLLTRSDDAVAPFLCMTHVGSAEDASGHGLWKVFSHAPLPTPLPAAVHALVRRAVSVVHEHVWEGAFPRLAPDMSTPEAAFVLAPGLAYTSALESVVSTMETQAIAGRVAARLIERDLVGT